MFTSLGHSRLHTFRQLLLPLQSCSNNQKPSKRNGWHTSSSNVNELLYWETRGRVEGCAPNCQSARRLRSSHLALNAWLGRGQGDERKQSEGNCHSAPRHHDSCLECSKDSLTGQCEVLSAVSGDIAGLLALYMAGKAFVSIIELLPFCDSRPSSSIRFRRVTPARAERHELRFRMKPRG